MKLTKYKIKRIAQPEDDIINQWQIQIELVPTWIERLFNIEFRRKTMVGSCIHWTWGNGSKVSYLWSIWAQNVVTRRIKKAKEGTTYVNSRFNRQKD